MFFRYFKEGDSVAENGQILRVLSDNATPYLLEKLADGKLECPEGSTADDVRIKAEAEGTAFKYKEVTFKDWWDHAVADDTKAKSIDGAAEGEFWSEIADPKTGEAGTVACSLETGEPIERK
jgi:hypothetical protein